MDPRVGKSPVGTRPPFSDAVPTTDDVEPELPMTPDFEQRQMWGHGGSPRLRLHDVPAWGVERRNDNGPVNIIPENIKVK